jgi:quercetin dioxygenase-like cupin family protein
VKEILMKTMRIAAVAMLTVTAPAPLQIAQARQPGATRTELQRHDLSVPGREVIQVRVELAPGVAFPSHTHPGEEIIYVIEGTWAYEIAGKTVTAKPGDVLFVPAGTIHSARNVGTGTAAELATYVVEKGRPLLTLVQ